MSDFPEPPVIASDSRFHYLSDRISDWTRVELLAHLLPNRDTLTAGRIIHMAEQTGVGLRNLSIPQLTSIAGVGVATARRIHAALELGRQEASPPPAGAAFREAADVWHLLRDLIGTLDHEEFWVIAMSRRNRRMGQYRVSAGSASATVVEPREVFRPAIQLGSSSIILAHNHPSNDPTPSNQDQLLTERLGRAGRTLGIDVIDHVVITRTSFCSFRERGLAML